MTQEEIEKCKTLFCPTRVFYNGEEIDINKIIVVWSDHMGDPDSGSLEEYVNSREADAMAEAEAGEGW